MALARLKFLKGAQLLNISSTTYDTQLKALLSAVSAFVDRYCRVVNDDGTGSLEKTTYTSEYYTGDETKKLFLRNFPVSSIASVFIWDGSDSYDQENSGHYALFDKRYIYFPALGQEGNSTWGAWPCYPNGIKVSYVAGYDTTNWDTADVPVGTGQTFAVPADLEYAVAVLAALAWQKGRQDLGLLGKTGLSVGPQSLSIESYEQGMPPDVKAILMNYKRANI